MDGYELLGYDQHCLKEKLGKFYYENNKMAQFTNEPRYEGEEVPSPHPFDEGAKHTP